MSKQCSSFSDIYLKSLSPKDYLRLLQRIYYIETGLEIGLDKLDIDKQISKYSSMPMYRGREEELRKDFECYRQHEGKTLFEEWVDQTLPFLKESDQARLRHIPRGDLPLFDANAAAIKVPAGGVILVWHIGLPILIHGFMELILAAGHDKIDSQQLHKGCFLHGLWFVTGARVGLPQEMIFSDDEILECSQVETYTVVTEYFVAAHEVAHVVLNHLDESSAHTRPWLLKSTIQEPYFLTRRHEQEFEADEYAMNLVLMALSKSPEFAFEDFRNVPSEASVDMFFTILRFLEQFWKREDISTPTHPSPKKRQYRLRELFWKRLSSDAKDVAKNFEEGFDKIWYNLEHSGWTPFKPHWFPCHNCKWPIPDVDAVICNQCKSRLCRRCIRLHTIKTGHENYSRLFTP